MQYAVEARVFYNGRTVALIRPAGDGEESARTCAETCEIFVDVVGTYEEARALLTQYRRG